MGQSMGITINRNKFFHQGLKMIDNSILSGDADTLYQFLSEDIYSAEDLDSAEFLHKTALVGHTECLRVLLEHDLSVNRTSKRQGYTPLHFAAISPNPGAVMCIKILCKFGAKLDHLGDKRCSRTPVHLAVEKGFADVIQELIAQGSRVNTVSECKMGISPLLYSIQCENPSPQCLKALLIGGADVHRSWIWKCTQTPPIDILSHQMKVNVDKKDIWCEMFTILLQADCDIIKTLTLMPSGQQTKVKDIRIYYALKEILKRLRKDYQTQAQELLMALVAHGYRPYGDVAKYIENYDLATFGWIRHYTSQPVSLKDQCVKVIRMSMRCNVMYCLHNMKGLLPPIKDDILFNGTPQPCLILL